MDAHHSRRRGAPQYRLDMPDCNEEEAGGQTARREFLRAGGCFVVACAALGLPASLAGLPMAETTGTGPANEKRFPLPAGDSVNIDRQTQVILVRFQNSVYAFALACPHEHAAVKWLPKDHRFQCSKHDSQYQPNGTYTAGRATRNLDRFAIRKEDAFIVVDLQHWFESDKNPTGWASSVVQV
jgi:nitrite reductase/ring-hydroxylating ferredoxin subunit